MMRRLLDGYGHAWTDEEQESLAEAVAACERKNLAMEQS